MGVSISNGLTAEDRIRLRSRGWLYGQPQWFQDAVLDRCLTADLPRGESAMNLGDGPRGLYGLISGWLDVLISPGSLDPALVHVATTGWWFGDSAMLTQTPTRGSHVARTRSRIAVLPSEAVRELERSGHDPWRRIAHISVGVIDHAFAILAANRCHQPLERTALTLRILMGEGLPFAAGEPLIPSVLPVSQTEFAEIANLSRNSAGDALRDLSDAGAIRLGYRKIEILNASILRSLR